MRGWPTRRRGTKPPGLPTRIDAPGAAPIETAAMSAMVGLRFDLRVPPFARTTHERQYAACLDMCEWADAKGFDVVDLGAPRRRGRVHVVARDPGGGDRRAHEAPRHQRGRHPRPAARPDPARRAA